MNTEKAIYIIESGKALDLVKEHIAHRVRIRKVIAALLKELGLHDATVWTDRRTGVLSSVRVKRGKQPDGFTVPDAKGRSWPKKGTEWAKRFADQKGYRPPSDEISTALNVPLSLEYKSKDGGTGWCCIGFRLSECGYLFMSEKGPYALWIPDVEQIVKDREAQGDTVTCEAKKFNMRLEGCRRIEPEEWDIMVKQHELAKKKAKREMAGAA